MNIWNKKKRTDFENSRWLLEGTSKCLAKPERGVRFLGIIKDI